MEKTLPAKISTNDAYSQILHAVCAEQQIALTELSDGWIKLATRGDVRHFIVGYNLGLNDAASSALASSKVDTYHILSNAGVPAVLHQIFYSPDNHEHFAKGRNSLANVVDFLRKHHNSIVLKPNGGTTGQHIYHVTSEDQIKPALQQIFSPNYWHDTCYAGAMSPYHEIQHEYRIIMLDGEPKFIYQKSLTPESDWKFNLSQGAVAEKVTDEGLRANLTSLAKATMRALALRFASVDVIQTKANELFVLEVNSGVSVNGYLGQHPEDFAEFKAIFAEAMGKIFA